MTVRSRESPVSSSGPPLAGGDLRPSPGSSPLSDGVGGVNDAMPQPRGWLGVVFFDMEGSKEEEAGVSKRRNTIVTDGKGPRPGWFENTRAALARCKKPTDSQGTSQRTPTKSHRRKKL